MKVTGIVNKIVYSDLEQKSRIGKTEQLKSKDVLSISGEARALRSESGKNLDEIREKVSNGYYNSEKVIAKVAEEIFKEITNS